MKKKILAIFLVVAMVAALAVGLTACKKDDGGEVDYSNIKIGMLCLHDKNSTYDKNFITAISYWEYVFCLIFKYSATSRCVRPASIRRLRIVSYRMTSYRTCITRVQHKISGNKILRFILFPDIMPVGGCLYAELRKRMTASVEKKA